MSISRMPNAAGVQEIIDHGQSRYGWQWLKDDAGDWWAAKPRVDYIYQVRGESPEFLARRWSCTMNDRFTPHPGWERLKDLLELR